VEVSHNAGAAAKRGAAGDTSVVCLSLTPPKAAAWQGLGFRV